MFGDRNNYFFKDGIKLLMLQRREMSIIKKS